jgi:hypothetical protein
MVGLGKLGIGVLLVALAGSVGCGKSSEEEGSERSDAGTGANAGSGASSGASTGGNSSGAGGASSGSGGDENGGNSGSAGSAGSDGGAGDGNGGSAGSAGNSGSAGNGGSGGSGDVCTLGSSEPIPEGELARSLAEVECSFLFSCDCASAAEDYADEATCRTERTALHLENQSDAQGASYTYQAECARRTVQYIRQVGCSRNPPSCLLPNCAIYAGTLTTSCATGGFGFSDPCVPDRRCTFMPSGGPFMCVARPAPLSAGDPCGPSYDCGYFAFCPQANSTCVAYGLAGEACGTDRPLCHQTTYCSDVSGECELRPSEGDACSNDEPCVSGHTCPPMTQICTPGGEPDVCRILF